MKKQCKKCPWRKDVDPRDIPNGYCEVKHANLRNTIAKPGDIRGIGSDLRMMACHESNSRGGEIPCVGWLANQLGPGNNIPLRIAAMHGRVNAKFELVGEQHETFEDTLPH